jgi:hypothetical protein
LRWLCFSWMVGKLCNQSARRTGLPSLRVQCLSAVYPSLLLLRPSALRCADCSSFSARRGQEHSREQTDSGWEGRTDRTEQAMWPHDGRYSVRATRLAGNWPFFRRPLSLHARARTQLHRGFWHDGMAPCSTATIGQGCVQFLLDCYSQLTAMKPALRLLAALRFVTSLVHAFVCFERVRSSRTASPLRPIAHSVHCGCSMRRSAGTMRVAVLGR